MLPDKALSVMEMTNEMMRRLITPEFLFNHGFLLSVPIIFAAITLS
jgi:hypothetical protein